ncbi:hypothetical protein Tco_0399455 [Tanacetum coccineum]
MLLKTKGEEINSLSAQLLLKEAEAAEVIHLRAEASRFRVVEKSLRIEGRNLTDINADRPSAKAHYLAALHHL